GTVDAMKTAAGNEGGAMNGFIGMGMAMNMGGNNAANLYAMGQNQPVGPQAGQAPNPNAWICSCGTPNEGRFCQNCGKEKPSANGWTCKCGRVNQGNFCANCGEKRPAGAPLYRCDKCGYQPEDPAHPPKFCPNCGDPFDTNDIQ
ncbi:MAG: SPFH domain-containing protein, partial [Clostridia bacterium]|nr:SPFH domain-containing protein [Clostridia bacterium]